MTACVIEDDIPYPLLEGAILSMTVEGQRAGEEGQSVEATIDAKARTVTLFVNDSVDLSRLKIKSLKVTEGATLMADSAACADILRFPTTGFASLDSISSDANTRVDFTKPVSFTVKTYQEYVWKVSVTQLIKREVDVTGQVADAVIDPVNRNVIIYVSPDQSLSDLQVNSLVGSSGVWNRILPIRRRKIIRKVPGSSMWGITGRRRCRNGMSSSIIRRVTQVVRKLLRW